MGASDTAEAAESLRIGLAPGGRSSIVLTMDTRLTPEGRAEEARLRAQIEDIPAWIERAEYFYVDPKMVALVCSAGAVVPDEATVSQHDLPAPYGFLLIGGGATLCHLQEPGSDEQISAEAFSVYVWACIGGQVQVRRFERAPECWYLLDTTMLTLETAIPPAVRAKDRTYPRRLIIPEGRPDATHTNVSLAVGPEAAELMAARESQTSDATLRWLVACWRLMGQTIAEVVDEAPTRQQRRQLERKRVPLRPVSVIRLRRLTSQGSGESSVNWSHRWVVRGHWRQQPHKDATGAWTTRAVFIHPYIKGPEEAPLLARRRISHLVR